MTRRSRGFPAGAAMILAVVAVLMVAAGGHGRESLAGSEVYYRPSDGVFHFAGRGFGHGRGLNQWGAHGAALRGYSAAQILDAYYPGTRQRTTGNRMVRVHIVEDEGKDLRIPARPGLTLFDATSGKRYRLRGAATGWRIVVTGSGLSVQRERGGRFIAWKAPDGRRSFRGPLRVAGGGMLRLLLPDGSAHDYRGALEAWRSGAGRMLTINRVSVENYLLAVVSREMPLWFHAEALKAQAIAARTYALNRINQLRGQPYHICSSSWDCQTYYGVRKVTASGRVENYEHPASTAAVRATRGIVRIYGSRPIYAEFSASNGGWSRAWHDWPRRPYLMARPDPWDAIASPHNSWTASVSARQIEARYPAVGRLLRIRILQRDGAGSWGGRVMWLALEGVSATGAATRVEVSGDDFIWTNYWPGDSKGLRSNWWVIR